MKTLRWFALLLIAPATLAQELPIDPTTGTVIYTEVVEVPGATKDQLYARAATWFSRAFKSAKSVIDLQDKEGGKIIGKGAMGVTAKIPMLGTIDAGNVFMTITLQSKDGKYKYTFDTFRHERPYGKDTERWVDGGTLDNEKGPFGTWSTTRPNKHDWKELRKSLASQMPDLIASLKKGMITKDDDF